MARNKILVLWKICRFKITFKWFFGRFISEKNIVTYLTEDGRLTKYRSTVRSIFIS